MMSSIAAGTGPNDNRGESEELARYYSEVLPEGLRKRLRSDASKITSEAIRLLSMELAFFKGLDANERANVHIIIQTAVNHFIEWVGNPQDSTEKIIEHFQLLPGDLTTGLTLQESVLLIRSTMDVFEHWVPLLSHDGEKQHLLREAILRYRGELGFAAASLYAGAAEARGAWDTRAEAAMVDAIVRAENTHAIQSRASALNWDQSQPVTVIVGYPALKLGLDVVTHVHDFFSGGEQRVLTALQGNRLIIVVTGEDPFPAKSSGRSLGFLFSPEPIVVGPTVPSLAEAHHSASEALISSTAVIGWPGAPRIISSTEVLPERAILGDPTAVSHLLSDVIQPLREAGTMMQQTLDSFLAAGGHIDECARELFIHPNTVRYRLKRILAVTGLDPLVARDCFTLQVANVLASFADHTSGVISLKTSDHLHGERPFQ